LLGVLLLRKVYSPLLNGLRCKSNSKFVKVNILCHFNKKPYESYMLNSKNVTRSEKRVLLPMTGNPIFHTNAKLHECTIRLQCQTWPVITGPLLLAAHSWPSGDPYEQSGVFIAPWEASSELCVLVKSRRAG